MSTPTPKPTTLADRQAERFNNNVARIAGDLRRLADQIEREAQPRRYPKTLARIAGDIIHELNWGFANLNADNLILCVDAHGGPDRGPRCLTRGADCRSGGAGDGSLPTC